MDRLLIIDGMNLLFQMFYGMPSRITGKDGKPIHGTLGFTGALLKALKFISPSHAIAVFDGETGSFRREIDVDYKQNRPDYSAMAEEDTPFCQLDDVYKALDLLQIRHVESCGCEADDLITAYALEFGKETVICSQDSDFFQLISPNITVFRYRGDNSLLCDTEYIKGKFGVSPEYYADLKALTGDKADNIRGADGIGPKYAAELINAFGHLENILDRTDDIKRTCVRHALEGEGERLMKNLALIRLTGGCTELPVPFAELEYKENGYKTTQIMSLIGLYG